MIGSFRIMLLKEKIDALNKHKRFICSRIFDEGGYARCEDNNWPFCSLDQYYVLKEPNSVMEQQYMAFHCIMQTIF